MSEQGRVDIDAPGDRDGSFHPEIVYKRQRRFVGFDDKILALYWAVDEGHRGAPGRDLRGARRPDLISRVTDAVMDDARAWQQRPLDDVYLVVFLDALVLKIQRAGRCSAAPAISRSGSPSARTATCSGCGSEPRKARSSGCRRTELKQRGVQDILIYCVDGLKGFAEAIEAIFLETIVQTWIVHMIRHRLKYVPRREREQVARDLKPIYTPVNADAAAHEIERFDEQAGNGSS